MKAVRVRLTNGTEGEVTIDIARQLITHGHAVEITSVPERPRDWAGVIVGDVGDTGSPSGPRTFGSGADEAAAEDS